MSTHPVHPASNCSVTYHLQVRLVGPPRPQYHIKTTFFFFFLKKKTKGFPGLWQALA